MPATQSVLNFIKISLLNIYSKVLFVNNQYLDFFLAFIVYISVYNKVPFSLIILLIDKST